MAFRLSDIKLSGPLPEWWRSMSVYRVKSPSLEERRPAMDLFADVMGLGELVPVEVRESLHLIGKRGEIQFYRPSGALWVRDTAADADYDDERRPWTVNEAPDDQAPGETKFVLDKTTGKELADRAGELFGKAGLLGEEAYFAGIEIDHVARLDERGQEVERFPGEANVRFLYKLGDFRIDGPGAKSYAFFNPGKREPRLTGLFHCWRGVEEARQVHMVGLEQALETTVAHDRELASYHEKGQSIELSKIDLVYYSLPAFKHQGYLFPALHVVGSVVREETEGGGTGFEFARFYNAAPTRNYADAGIYADYLTDPL